MSKYAHDDNDSFVEALRTTARDTGFPEAMIEKDYFCSLILRAIFSTTDHGLVFKGGTLLNKVHAGFYRLSEDLDFSISAEPELTKKKRSAAAQPAKAYLSEVVSRLFLRFSDPLRGYNESSQYNGEIEYPSLLLGGRGTIKIDIGIREKVFSRVKLNARTLVRDSFSQEPLIEDFTIEGLSLEEAYAEKIRAALSRKEPAIRDVFDIDYALKGKLFDVTAIASMVKEKLQVGDRTVDLSNERKKSFSSQLLTELRPVLRESDFSAFDFEDAWVNLNILKDTILKGDL